MKCLTLTRKAKFTVLLLIQLCMLTSSLQAQRGVIKGTVSDFSSKSSLTGAVITIESLRRMSITDVNGEFLIGNLPEGTISVKVTYLGYGAETQEVTIKAGETNSLSFLLTPESYTSEVVEITAQALGQTQAINQQLNSDAIANIVSADRIQELPDVNAAEAIARLPGIAINRSGGEGQKVVIRGLEPKFAAITINGINLPSNSSTDRSVDLSLIAPELLDGIEVFKSPLPDMDAEALGGTVNLKLRKAPKDFRLLARGLWGYNDLNNDFRDHKGILQLSNRIFNDKLGIVFQGGLERFNRGVDIITNGWRQGRTVDSVSLAEILGRRLRLQDRQEIRKRYNSSLGLDYDFGKSQLSFFGLYSRTTRDQFSIQEELIPGDQEITYSGNEVENSLDLTFLALSGVHNLGPLEIDWSVADSRSIGETPYDFTMNFVFNDDPFADDLNPDANPRRYLEAAQPNLSRTILEGNGIDITRTFENTRSAVLNFELPVKLGSKITGSFKTGGKYKNIIREREVEEFDENFYFLGANEIRRAIQRYDGDLEFLAQGSDLVSINSFAKRENDVEFRDFDGNDIGLGVNLDPDLMRDWYEAQKDILNANREALQENYEVDEKVYAGYAMLKLNFGEKLTIIPGFRYEYSDNEYRGGLSTLNGRYGVNGIFRDTTTFQNYGQFLPHLHLKYSPNNWLDIRASYAKTMARPDFNYISPLIQIDDNQTTVTTGNPDLNYAVSTNYDLSISAYKGGYGLLTLSFFYKDLENIFYPWDFFLINDSTAQAFGFPDQRGYSYSSFINSESGYSYGFEVDLQTTLSFLPEPFNGLVFNINYARLFSNTEVFFLTSETVLVRPVPPVFRTEFESVSREVDLRSQAPHILRASLGYDYKGFSARVSAAYQGTKVNRYSVNRGFDTFDKDFWRVDASMKQKFGKHISVFLNLNNLSNQKDISFTREERFTNSVQTYGITGTLGLQYKL
ncbi:MAG: TonB-dependent receptor [Bacteroidota bacterium]